MKDILLNLFIFLKLFECKSLDELSPGKMTHSLFIEELRSTNYCYDYDGNCDFKILTQLCVYHKQYRYGYIKRGRNKLSRPISFRINLWKKSVSTNRDFLETCSEIAHKSIPNTNNFRGNFLANKFTHVANPVYSYTIVIGDDPYQYRALGTVIFATLLRSAKYMSTYHFKKSHNYISFAPDLYLTTLSKSVCSDYFYGINCAFECKNSSKIRCFCDKYKLQRPCEMHCYGGFYITNVMAKIFGNSFQIPKCVNYTSCGHAYKCDNICVMDNSIMFCENPLVLFSSDYAYENISVDSHFVDEKIYVKFLDYSMSKEFNNSKGIADIEILVEEETQVKVGPGFQWFSKPYYKPVSIIITIYLKLWINKPFVKMPFKIEHGATIHPKRPIMSQNGTGKPVSGFVILGQPLVCNISVGQNYYITTWNTGGSFDLNSTISDMIYIPIKTTLDSVKVSCKIYLITERLFQFNLSKILTIKKYKNIKWSINNDIIWSWNKVKCVSTVFVAFTKRIVQISGDTVPIKDYTLQLTDVNPGEYEFKCLVQIKTIILTRRLKFRIIRRPSNICFFLYQNVPGGIIQCGHNGAFTEDYKIMLSFYSLEPQPVLKVEGSVAIHMPIHIEKRAYKVVCEISSQKHEFTVEKSITNNFSTNSRENYFVTDDNAQCAKYMPYVEMPKFVQVNKTHVQLTHSMYYHTYFGSETFYGRFRITVILFLIWFMILTLPIYLVAISDQQLSNFRTCSDMELKRKMLCRFNFMRRIDEKVNDLTGVHGTANELKQLFQKSFQVSDFKDSPQ